MGTVGTWSPSAHPHAMAQKVQRVRGAGRAVAPMQALVQGLTQVQGCAANIIPTVLFSYFILFFSTFLGAILTRTMLRCEITAQYSRQTHTTDKKKTPCPALIFPNWNTDPEPPRCSLPIQALPIPKAEVGLLQVPPAQQGVLKKAHFSVSPPH